MVTRNFDCASEVSLWGTQGHPKAELPICSIYIQNGDPGVGATAILFAMQYLCIFLLNYFAELLVARLCLPMHDVKRLASVVLLMNVVTHPLFWYLMSAAYRDYWIKLLAAEVVVVAVEAMLGLWLLKQIGVSRKRIMTSVFACNLFSFLLTFLI